MIDGVSTSVTRVGCQGNLSLGQVGSALGGTFLAPVAGSIGRLDIMISSGCNSSLVEAIAYVNQAPNVDAGADQTVCVNASVTLCATGS